MAAYVPGYQPADEAAYVKLNTNENPYAPSPAVIEAIISHAGSGLRRYPDPGSLQCREIAGHLYGFSPDWIIMANGSDEVLNNLIRAFAGEGEEIGYIHPSYSYYETLALIQGAKVRRFSLTPGFEIADFPETYHGKVLFLTSPNSPLGFSFPLRYIEELASRIKGMLVVDEAYADFADDNALRLVRDHENIVVTRTLSKSYSLAGMRLGLAIAHPPVIAALNKIRDHYNLDKLAQAAAAAALRDQNYFSSCIRLIRDTRDWFTARLEAIGYAVIPSCANFVFATPPDRDGERIYQGLFDRKILVRHFRDPLLSQGLRISIGTREEMDQTLSALNDIG
jgi:histidinol-phosphate aminotransferase